MTIFIYIINTGEKNLKDVINTTEKELFEKIYFISVDEFNKLYENKLFKEQVLDKAIHGFYNQELISRDWREIIGYYVLKNKN